MNKKLNKKVAFKGTLTLLSGLYIGDSNEQVDIGGIDRTVVRRPDNNQPYIPGSSLKGKIRSLLEQTRGAAKVGDSEEINKLFGNIENKGKKIENRASRLIVRDSYLTEDSEKTLSELIYTDYPYTEIKFENSIDRVSGTANHGIRKTERVLVGSIFSIELIVNIWSGEDEASEAEQIALLQEGIALLEADYLGGSGSRGYGQVQIDMDFEKPQILYPGEYAGAK
jgi:CRISPR-associated protein Csm3